MGNLRHARSSCSLYLNGKESYHRSMEYASTVSEKGQVTLPKPIRDALGIRTGERLAFRLHGEEIRVRKRPDRDRLAELYGSLKLPAPVDQLIDEMRGGPADL